MFNKLSVSHFPGFQRGHTSTLVELSSEEIRKTLADFSVKPHKKEVFSVRDSAIALGYLKQLSKYDWDFFREASSEISVDDVDLYIFESEFGKVSIPLEYILDTTSKTTSLYEASKNLYSLVEKLFALGYSKVKS